MSQSFEDNGGAYGDLVYSPDLQTFDLQGSRGMFSTIASFMMGPIRIATRIPTNIGMLPDSQKGAFGNALLITGITLGLIGMADLIAFHKWPLVVSQIPVIFLGVKYKAFGKKSGAEAYGPPRREIVVDTTELNNYCNELNKELDSIVSEYEGEK